MSQTPTDTMPEPHQSRAARERRAAAERARRHRAAQREAFDAMQSEVEALRAEVERLRDAAAVGDALAVGFVRAGRARHENGRIVLAKDDVKVDNVVIHAAYSVSGRDQPRYREAVSLINRRLISVIDSHGLK